MLTLSELWIYPIKSLAGISLSSAKAKPLGLEHDRRWMLVDAGGRFVSQRTFPRMATLAVALDETRLRVWHREQPDDALLIPYQTASSATIRVEIWDDTVEALLVSEAADRWFSEKLGTPLRLVFLPEAPRRAVDPRYALAHDHVSFADGYPYLIISQASLDDLNRRLPEPIGMQRFRPNLVVQGALPYAEDHWTDFRIGEVTFGGVKPCARCVLTTLDPVSLEKGPEPLKTLATYRKQDNKILFGMNTLLVGQEGLLRVGDPIHLGS